MRGIESDDYHISNIIYSSSLPNIVSYICESWGIKTKERKGKDMCRTKRRKSGLHGSRTHTFCYPGRCPKPVRLEGPT